MNSLRTICILLSFSLLPVSHGIIVRHDVASGDYEVRAIDYPSVFFLERQGNRKVCVATVIHPQWALTAAHCAEETLLDDTVAAGRRFAVDVANRNREIDLVIKHPDYDQQSASDIDLALLRFRNPSPSPRPVPLQTSNTELGEIVTLVGWGYFGIGTLGRQYDDGRMRRANNRVTVAERYLRFEFDDPRDRDLESLSLEGVPGLGDSGGPAFIENASGLALAGIAVGQIKGSDFSEETQGKYGAIAIYERVSRHIDWIETVVGSKLPFGS
jgi:secreted trypsin-like serine protease